MKRNKVLIVPKDKSLAELRSHLLSEWDFKLNLEVDPSTIGPGSKYLAYWLCSQFKHSYQSSVCGRSSANRGCPFCANRLIYPGFNDLLTISASISKEWDFDKNKEKTPETVLYGSHYKAWWLCSSHNHSYKATVKDRVSGKHNCPFCANKKVLVGFNDLLTTHNYLNNDWDYDNNKISPLEITSSHSGKIWWKCRSFNHSYQRVIKNQIISSECPYCSNRIILKGFNDLEFTHSHLMPEWDYKNNKKLPSSISSGSNYRAQWTCKKCKENWKATVKDRVGKNSGCPNCKLYRSSKREVTTRYYLQKFFSDVKIFTGKKNGYYIDIILESESKNIYVEYDGSRFHGGPERVDKNKSSKIYLQQDESRDSEILSQDNDITIIRLREPRCPEYTPSDSVKVVNLSGYSNKDLYTGISNVAGVVCEITGWNQTEIEFNTALDREVLSSILV